MEKKTKHRLLGILVIVGLVIILLPLFQSGKESSSPATLVKAPPFPDQSIQVTSQPIENSPQPVSNTSSPPIEQPTSQVDTVNQQPDDTIPANQSMVSHEPSISQPAVVEDTTLSHDTDNQKNKLTEAEPVINAENSQTKLNDEAVMSSSNEPIQQEKNELPTTQISKKENKIKSVPTIRRAVHIIKYKPNMKAPSRISLVQKGVDDKNGLIKLKNAAWVIQIGSFKNKANALRLVNQLRAKGYRTFIQQVSTSFGESTRVFVGPESKQASARALADQLVVDLHIHGIVISYQPFTL